MKGIDIVKAFAGGVASGLAGYSANAILRKACPMTGDWRKDLALKAGCGLIGGMVAAKVEEGVCKDVDDYAQAVADIREAMQQRKQEALDREDKKLVKQKAKYVEVGEVDPEMMNSMKEFPEPDKMTKDMDIPKAKAGEGDDADGDA